MFLGLENFRMVSQMFDPRVVYTSVKKKAGHTSGSYSKKNLLQIGIHELTFKTVEMRKTRNGGQMLYVQIYKKPDYYYLDDNEKVSYNTIDCYHVASNYGSDKPTKWYDRFTTDMSLGCLMGLAEKFVCKPVFKAVVGLRQLEVIKDGVRVLDGFGNGVYRWENFIESVCRVDDDVGLNNDDYFRLFQYIEFPKPKVIEDEIEVPF